MVPARARLLKHRHLDIMLVPRVAIASKCPLLATHLFNETDRDGLYTSQNLCVLTSKLQQLAAASKITLTGLQYFQSWWHGICHGECCFLERFYLCLHRVVTTIDEKVKHLLYTDERSGFTMDRRACYYQGCSRYYNSW